MILISVLLVLFGGFCSAVQSPTNATLSSYVGNFQSATISFAGGAAVMLLAMIAVGDGNLAMIGQAPVWQWIGGIYGAFLVLMITFAAPVLGIALTLTMSMFGQIVMGIIVDTFGLLGTEAVPFSPLRILGAVLVAAGIVLVYIGKTRQGTKLADSKAKVALIGFLMFLAGVGATVQTPTNAALAIHVGKWEAGFVSFFGGFLILLIFTLIINRGKMHKIKGTGVRAWMCIGGVYGAAVVFVNMVAVPYIGAALVVSAAMFGSLAGALIIDNYGLFRAAKVDMNRWRYVGVLVIACGVVLVTVAKL